MEPVELTFSAEIGFLAPLAHHIQFDSGGTRLDYVKDGGQDNLFPVARAEVGMDLKRHHVQLVFQPLQLRSRTVLDFDLTENETTFVAGTPIDLLYGFSFWRAGWQYDLAKSETFDVAIGLSMQIRNADIEFTSADGEQRVVERNIGPVPLLSARVRQDRKSWWWLWEAEGAYAPVSYLNGDNNEVVGSLIDTSLRAGVSDVRGFRPFVNVRFLAGGAKGFDEKFDGPGDGYTDNFLYFGTLSIGAELPSRP